MKRNIIHTLSLIALLLMTAVSAQAQNSTKKITPAQKLVAFFDAAAREFGNAHSQADLVQAQQNMKSYDLDITDAEVEYVLTADDKSQLIESVNNMYYAMGNALGGNPQVMANIEALAAQTAGAINRSNILQDVLVNLNLAGAKVARQQLSR